MGRPLSPAVIGALTVVGSEIRAARQQRGWTLEDLAERAGVSEKTVRSIEAGSTGASVGTLFEIAWLVGLELLGRDEMELPSLVARSQERLSVAPQRVRKPVRKSRESF